MTVIEEIRKKIAQNRFEYSQHAVDQSIIRHIGVSELNEAIAHGEIIEDLSRRQVWAKLFNTRIYA